MNTNTVEPRDEREMSREDERQLEIDIEIFHTTPLVSPAAATWSNVPGSLLIRTDEQRVPSPVAFSKIVWAGILRPLPLLPPSPPVPHSDDYEERIKARFEWWSQVRAWRSECDPAALATSWLLSGPCGSGKTRAAIARAQVWSLASGVKAMTGARRYSFGGDDEARIAFVRGVEFAPAAVAEAKGEPSKITGVTELGNLSRIPFLILDDLDAGNWTPAALAALYLLMDNRLNRALVTVISFNGTAEEWRGNVSNRYPGEVIMVDKILRRMGDLCTRLVFEKKK